MNIREAIAELEDFGLPKSKIEQVIRSFLKNVKQELINGGTFSVRGFGRFEVYHNKTGRRVAYDFQTKKTTMVPCKPKVKFSAHFLKDLEGSKG